MSRRRALHSMCLAALLAAVAAAQDPSAFAPPSPGQVSGAQRPSMRLLFAQSLAAAAQTMGSSLIIGLTQSLTGGLTHWLERRAQRRQRQGAVDPAFVPAQAPAQAQFFDAQTGQATTADPNLVNAATVASVGEPGAPPQAESAPNAEAAASTTLDLFAGLAFEVHALGADGATTPVNPATHDFRTGDQFVIFFRPTLPGRMEVYNINASGTQTQIDLQVIAAGQLARLGPYQFAAQTGDEQLKLVIVPCTTPALAVATRDIVNVAAGASATGTGAAGVGLETCGPAVRSIGRVRTRDIRTRDIRKVAVEGTTGFALDEVTPQERSSGQIAPREVTILMRHR